MQLLQGNSLTVSAIVLAAGLSRRMGTNKLLLPLGEHTVLEQVVAVLQACLLDEIVAVTGHEPDKIKDILNSRHELQSPPNMNLPQQVEDSRTCSGHFQVRDALPQRPLVRTIHNPDYAAGEMFSSIQTGLRALREDCQAALIALGDQPQIERRVAERVLAAHAPGRVVIPSFNRRGGHPILIDRACWPDILACPPDANLRDVWRAHPVWLRYVDVDSDTILRDLDTPEDYRQMTTHL
jgi:molybdenum cofactor cytidylyltransferase